MNGMDLAIAQNIEEADMLVATLSMAKTYAIGRRWTIAPENSARNDVLIAKLDVMLDRVLSNIHRGCYRED